MAPIRCCSAIVELVAGLVGPVQRDALGREAGPQRQRQLPRRAHVQRQPLVVQPADDLAAQERLSGVVHARWRRRRRRRNPGSGCGSRPRRSASAGCRRQPARSRTSTPARLHRAAAVRGGRRGPDRRIERVQIGGRRAGGPIGVQFAGARTGRMCPHIRSGASTPSTARPLASTCRVAAHSHNRATFARTGLLVAHRQHPDRVVELVVARCQVLQVPRHPVRFAQIGGGAEDRRGRRPAARSARTPAGCPAAPGRSRRSSRARCRGRRRCGPARPAGRARTARRTPGCRWSAGSTGRGPGPAWCPPSSGSASTGRRPRRGRRSGRPG